MRIDLDRFSIPMSRPDIDEKERKFMLKVFDSNWPTQGKITRDFEEKLDNYLNSNCVVVNNGSSALMASLLVHGIKPGDRVIVPAFTFIASSSIPKILGAEILVSDIDTETLNATPEQIEEVVKNNDVKFVITVDVGGLPSDIDKIKKLSKEYDFILIEDAAQSFGAEYKKKKLGSFDHLTVFSFQITKLITTVEGGCIASTNSTLLQKINKIKDYGRTDKLYVHDTIGTNFRTTDLQSALGIEQLKKVEDHILRRNQIVEQFKKALTQFDFQKVPDYVSRHSYMLFFVKADNEQHREQCIKTLNKNGIDARKSWLPIHMQPCNNELNNTKIPNTEEIYQRVFTVPLFNNMSDEEVQKIIHVTKEL